MIIGVLYLLLLLYVIYTNGCFGLFKDDVITKKIVALLFLLKSLAIPIFYYVYQIMYGGIEKFDSGKFFNDVSVLSEIAKTDLPTYFKFLFGFQNDTPGSYDFLLVQNTWNWDNGEIKDFLYNDNRVLIRVHSLLHLISFGSWFAQALFSCFLSFIGIYFLYKSFAEFFKGKEIFVLLILCLFPALWFYTGALLKEGLTVFILGFTVYTVKKVIVQNVNLKTIIVLLVLLWFCFLLKPYLLFFALCCFSLFFYLQHAKKIKLKLMSFVLSLCVLLVAMNILSVSVKQRSLLEAALIHQRIFAGVAKGGIFLYNDTTFMRLAYDSTLVNKIPRVENVYTIKKNASFMYWKNGKKNDTLYCESNEDTLSRYQLAYKLPLNNSNLEPVLYSGSLSALLLHVYYYTLVHPFFVNAHSALQYLASLENLLIVISLIIILIGFFSGKKDLFLPFCFLVFALGICLLIGIATPNSGAIFRYRSPAMVFLLLAALYFVDVLKLKIFK